MNTFKCRWHLSLISCLVLLTSACTTPSNFISTESRETGVLSESTVSLNASSPALAIKQGTVLTDNDDAFESKISLIDAASKSIDLAYYIYADDFTSATLSRALVRAAQRGVRVRLLVDYHANYKRLDMFSMMESVTADGPGHIEVRFYNRPTVNIIKDAVYVTLGCGEHKPEFSDCSEDKFTAITDELAQAEAQGQLDNANIAGSGLFLSGLYAKNPNLMVTAIQEGYNIDPALLKKPAGAENADQLENLKKLGKIYYQARYGSGLDRVLGSLKLRLSFALYADQVTPVYDAFSAFLPVEQQDRSKLARQEWRFITDFLHHKLLLVDGHRLQLGGRNIEDSYHMNPGPMSSKYIFMDTDVALELDSAQYNGITAAYEKIWNFTNMVATINDIRQHAPNDVLTAMQLASLECETTKASADKEQYNRCISNAFSEAKKVSLAERHLRWESLIIDRANQYSRQYQPKAVSTRSPKVAVDQTAEVYYVENLPFKSDEGKTPRRAFGATNQYEGDNGKHIHAIWLAALNNVCQQGEQGVKKDVIIHNAYFFLSSNLLDRLAQMVDGRINCGNVDITVVTNSIQTTDLNVVNILSRHSMKAFFDHIKSSKHPQKGANFRYYEYLPDKAGRNLSLHTKVGVFGDDIFIGSANADVRSYMMDSNNGLLVRNAPGLIGEYNQRIQQLISNGKVKQEDQYFLTTPRDSILAEDLQTIDALFAKYRAERWLKTDDDVKEIKQHLTELLDEVYNLSIGIVSGSSSSMKDQQEKFNALLKTI